MANENNFATQSPLAATVSAPVVLFYKNNGNSGGGNADGEVRFADVPDLDTLFGRVLYLKWRAEVWVVIIVTLAIAGVIFALVATGASLFRFCKDSLNRDYTLLTAAFIAPGVILTFFAVAPFVTQANEIICSLRIILPALGYACMYSMILGRLLALSSFYLCNHTLQPSQRRIFCIQIILFLILFAIQVAVSATQYVFGRFYFSPSTNESYFRDHVARFTGDEQIELNVGVNNISASSSDSTARTRYYTALYNNNVDSYRCGFTPMYMLIQLIYPMVLILLCLLLSINFAYRNVGGLLLSVVSGLGVIVWIVWSLLYGFLDTRWNDLCICAGLVAHGYVVLLGLLGGDPVLELLRNDDTRDRQRLGLVQWSKRQQQSNAGAGILPPNFLLTNDFNYNPQNGLLPDYYRYDHSGISAVQNNGDVVIAKLPPQLSAMLSAASAAAAAGQSAADGRRASAMVIRDSNNSTLMTSDDARETSPPVKFLGARPLRNSLDYLPGDYEATKTPQPPMRRCSNNNANTKSNKSKNKKSRVVPVTHADSSVTSSSSSSSSIANDDDKAGASSSSSNSSSSTQHHKKSVELADAATNTPLRTNKSTSTTTPKSRNDESYKENEIIVEDDGGGGDDSHWGQRLNLSFRRTSTDGLVKNALSPTRNKLAVNKVAVSEYDSQKAYYDGDRTRRSAASRL